MDALVTASAAVMVLNQLQGPRLFRRLKTVGRRP
jgi:hypothetical protein